MPNSNVNPPPCGIYYRKGVIYAMEDHQFGQLEVGAATRIELATPTLATCILAPVLLAKYVIFCRLCIFFCQKLSFSPVGCSRLLPTVTINTDKIIVVIGIFLNSIMGALHGQMECR